MMPCVQMTSGFWTHGRVFMIAQRFSYTCPLATHTLLQINYREQKGQGLVTFVMSGRDDPIVHNSPRAGKGTKEPPPPVEEDGVGPL